MYAWKGSFQQDLFFAINYHLSECNCNEPNFGVSIKAFPALCYRLSVYSCWQITIYPKPKRFFTQSGKLSWPVVRLCVYMYIFSLMGDRGGAYWSVVYLLRMWLEQVKPAENYLTDSLCRTVERGTLPIDVSECNWINTGHLILWFCINVFLNRGMGRGGPHVEFVDSESQMTLML